MPLLSFLVYNTREAETVAYCILWGDRNTKVGLKRGATSRTEDKPGYFLDHGPQSFFILRSTFIDGAQLTQYLHVTLQTYYDSAPNDRSPWRS